MLVERYPPPRGQVSSSQLRPVASHHPASSYHEARSRIPAKVITSFTRKSHTHTGVLTGVCTTSAKMYRHLFQVHSPPSHVPSSTTCSCHHRPRAPSRVVVGQCITCRARHGVWSCAVCDFVCAVRAQVLSDKEDKRDQLSENIETLKYQVPASEPRASEEEREVVEEGGGGGQAEGRRRRRW
eukprot:2835839-Rhodomonas_salina.1